VAALRLIWRAELRRHWRDWLALTLVAGVAFGVALTTAEAAHRSSTSVARYRAATREEDVEVTWLSFEGGPRIDLDAAERLPQVAAAGRRIDVTPLGVVGPNGVVGHSGDVRIMVPVGESNSKTADKPLLRAGRAPSPRRPDEVMVDQVMASALGLHVGSTMLVRLFTSSEARGLLGGTANRLQDADPRREGAGPLLTLHVVGINAWLDDSEPLGDLVASASFPGSHLDLGLAAPYLAVRLHDPSQLPAFASAVAKLYPRGAPVTVDSQAPFGAPTVAAIDLESSTVWLLAAAAAVMAFVGVAPALARRTARAGADDAILRGIGLGRRSMTTAGLAGPFATAAGSTVIAAVVAVVASPLTAVGVSRALDPASGITVDWSVLAIGAAAAGTSLLLVGAFAARRAAVRTSAEAAGTTRRQLTLGSRLAGAGAAPVAVVLGVRSALAGGAGRLRVPVMSTVAAIAAMFAVVTAGVVVAASSARLLDTPRLYGQNYVILGSVGGEPERFIARALRGAERDRSVRGVMAGALTTVTIDGRSVGLLGARSVKGTVPISLQSGRAPAGPREIALANRTIAALGVDLGDTVRVRGTGRTLALRVTGVATLPYLYWRSQGVAIGNGAMVALRTLRALVPGTPISRILVRPAPGVDPDREVAALTRTTSTFWSLATRPAEVTKLTHVRSVPYLLIALVALSAVAALSHLLIATTRRRRREIAILKALGLRRRDVRTTTFAQSATTVAIGCLVGIPLGVVAGFWVWDVLADRMGVVAEPVLPASTALLVPGALALCVLVAVVPAVLAARTPAAAVLRTE
jgi:ABC-type lipoprotein release transport system permease subunit